LWIELNNDCIKRILGKTMKDSGDLLAGSASLQVADSINQQTHYTQPENRQLAYDALVLDAQLRQSLATVRSLGSRGLRVAALATSSGMPAFSSRWCQQAFVCPAVDGTEAYLLYLEQLLDRIGVRVLITSSDATIALIRRHRERLEQRVRIALAKEPALAIAVSKERTMEVAKRLGLRIPHAVNVGAVSEVGAALREIGLPAVVKPAESWAWSGQQGTRLMVDVVTTPDEAQRAVEELTRFGGTTLFQEFIPGRRESISFLYAHGQIYARFAQRHEHSSEGQSTLRQSIAVPQDIGDQAERLVREIELEGCSEVEFRRDKAGNAYLMEINPRLWASAEQAVRSRVDFPYLLYQWASGEKIDMVKSYRIGGWLRYLRGDITATRAALRQRGRPGVASPAKTILDFCFAFFLPTGYDYVDWKDPLPAWRATTGSVRDLLQRAGKSLTGTRNL
jgi:predicted ATP-grasp superfamily ATP-dependent carboligase